ncbi:hypothetical protein TYRP_000104 [Tyrophagus putrescentiae]|nr:hypothetical protein TYRP_000104 [Tyrophagus putrescentiae]
MKVFFIFSLFVASGFASSSSPTHIGDKYLVEIGQIYTKVGKIYQDFEVNTVKLDKAEFTRLIEEIKTEKAALNKARAEVSSVLTTLISYHVLDKVYLEYARIMADSYSEALNQIAFEILGHEAGVSQFKPTYVSEAINIATALLKGKFDKIVNELTDVDALMTTILNHRNTSTDLFNELRVLNELSKTIADSLTLKTQLLSVYSEENEKAITEGKHLNILQKSDVDMHVVMIDWLVQFVRTYQELIKKLIG